MKKFFFLMCLMLSAVTALAQNTQKVAILEVVDRENQLTYSQKLVLRSNMARAITNTDGYEAYDRSDVDVIMSEQDFQRTGIVSENEIRKLGEMTGVSLILVTEGVLLDANKIFVTAKILNVETGRVDMTDNTTMGLDAGAMQQGCNELARKLFGVGAVSSQAAKYKVSALGGNYYSYRGQTLDERAYMNFLRNNCPEAFAKYNKGRAMTISGWVALSAGLVITGVGATMCVLHKQRKSEYDKQYDNQIAKVKVLRNDYDRKYGDYPYITETFNFENPEQNEDLRAYVEACRLEESYRDQYFSMDYVSIPGYVLCCAVGPVLTIGSIPLLHYGIKAKKKSIEMYNENCASTGARPVSLNLISSRNGLGLALQF